MSDIFIYTEEYQILFAENEIKPYMTERTSDNHYSHSEVRISVNIGYCIVLHGVAWYCMVLHGIVWYCMVLHGIAW